MIEDRCGGHLPDHSGLDHRDDVVGEPVQIQGRWELQAHNLSVTQTTVTILTSVVDPETTKLILLDSLLQEIFI